LRVQRISDVFALVSPGPRNQYGFMHFTDRMALSYRNDGGQGISYAGIPGIEMPISADGWSERRT